MSMCNDNILFAVFCVAIRRNDDPITLSVNLLPYPLLYFTLFCERLCCKTGSIKSIIKRIKRDRIEKNYKHDGLY